MPEVLEKLERSDDPIEREVARALREYQKNKALHGLPRSMGYEPRDILELGVMEVIERRVRKQSSGFDEVPAKDSYEAIVLRFPDRFDPEVVEIARKRISEEEIEFRPTADPQILEAQVRRLLERKHLPFPPGTKKPQRVDAATTAFLRDPIVKAFVLRMAHGHCEACGTPAPFKTLQGAGYLEVHHMKTLADGGSDRVQNAVALCPTCHRALHYASDAAERASRIYKRVERLVPE